MAKHIHADLMLQYTQDAQTTDTPWTLWQHWSSNQEKWINMGQPILWYPTVQYRHKPETILINVFEVPKPLSVAPDKGIRYYFPSFLNDESYDSFLWDNHLMDTKMLAKGLIHLTQEAAVVHAKALLSFTESK